MTMIKRVVLIIYKTSLIQTTCYRTAVRSVRFHLYGGTRTEPNGAHTDNDNNNNNDSNNNKNYNSLNNYYKSGKRLSSNFGNIFHNIMSEIEYKHQKDYVINEYLLRGIINNDDKNIINNYINQIISHEYLSNFFSKKN